MAGLLTLAAIWPLYGTLAGLSSLWQLAAVTAVAAAIYPLAAHFLRVTEMGMMARLIGKTAVRFKR
jgi:low affinity Fe/Cu permease